MMPSGLVMDAQVQRTSSLGSLSFSLVGIVGVLALVIAGATVIALWDGRRWLGAKAGGGA